MGRGREIRLIQSFALLLPDHIKDFESFVRDVEDVRFCHAPLDKQQLARCEYALRNMDMLLLSIHDALKAGLFDGDVKEHLIGTKNDWMAKKERVDVLMRELHDVVSNVDHSLGAIRRVMDANSH